MASGYFPLNAKSDPGKQLVEAARLIETVVTEYCEYCSEQDQTDNAFSDGGYVSGLGLAARLVKETLTWPEDRLKEKGK